MRFSLGSPEDDASRQSTVFWMNGGDFWGTEQFSGPRKLRSGYGVKGNSKPEHEPTRTVHSYDYGVLARAKRTLRVDEAGGYGPSTAHSRVPRGFQAFAVY